MPQRVSVVLSMDALSVFLGLSWAMLPKELRASYEEVSLPPVWLETYAESRSTALTIADEYAFQFRTAPILPIFKGSTVQYVLQTACGFAMG
jgi:hypothetical protein